MKWHQQVLNTSARWLPCMHSLYSHMQNIHYISSHTASKIFWLKQLNSVMHMIDNEMVIDNSYFSAMWNRASATPSDVCRIDPVCSGVMSYLAALSPGPHVVWTHGGKGHGFTRSSSLTILYSQTPPYTPSFVCTANQPDVMPQPHHSCVGNYQSQESKRCLTIRPTQVQLSEILNRTVRSQYNYAIQWVTHYIPLRPMSKTLV